MPKQFYPVPPKKTSAPGVARRRLDPSRVLTPPPVSGEAAPVRYPSLHPLPTRRAGGAAIVRHIIPSALIGDDPYGRIVRSTMVDVLSQLRLGETLIALACFVSIGGALLIVGAVQ